MNAELGIALIAAGAALFGALIGQLGPVVQDWLSARRTRRALLRERFEELAMLSTQLKHALVAEVDGSSRRSHGSSEPARPDHAAIARIEVLCLVYFREFEGSADSLRHSWHRCVEAMRAGASERAVEASREFALARDSMRELIRQRAGRYT